jgi:hypothetical protein
LVTRAAKLRGKTPAGHLRAVFVEGNQVCGASASPESLAPLPSCDRRDGRRGSPGLARFDAGKADRAAGGGGPLDIARGQIPFRSGFRPPNANEQKTQRVCNWLP